MEITKDSISDFLDYRSKTENSNDQKRKTSSMNPFSSKDSRDTATCEKHVSFSSRISVITIQSYKSYNVFPKFNKENKKR